MFEKARVRMLVRHMEPGEVTDENLHSLVMQIDSLTREGVDCLRDATGLVHGTDIGEVRALNKVQSVAMSLQESVHDDHRLTIVGARLCLSVVFVSRAAAENRLLRKGADALEPIAESNVSPREPLAGVGARARPRPRPLVRGDAIALRAPDMD